MVQIVLYTSFIAILVVADVCDLKISLSDRHLITCYIFNCDTPLMLDTMSLCQLIPNDYYV